MVSRKRLSPVDADAWLAEWLVDAYGDDEQLTSLCEGIAQTLRLPIDVHVVGEPMSLVAVDYDGNPRRGLIAKCCREDGAAHWVAFADIQLAPDAVGYPCLAAYCKWLGVEPARLAPALGPKTGVRQRRANEEPAPRDAPVRGVSKTSPAKARRRGTPTS